MIRMRAILFLNGEFPKKKEFYEELNIDENNLFCADGGARKALELNLVPREVWGDFDSLDTDEIEELRKKKVVLKSFNKDKDFTDSELLIDYLDKSKYTEILVVGGTGKRIDHFLTNINLIFKYPQLKFITEKETIFFVKKKEVIEDEKGSIISFIPFSDEVIDLTLKGFKYSLEKFLLKRGEALCMSNILIEERAIVEYTSGKLLGIITRDK